MEPKKLLKPSNTSFSRDDDVTAAMLMSQTKKLWLCIPTQSSQPIKRNLDWNLTKFQLINQLVEKTQTTQLTLETNSAHRG